MDEKILSLFFKEKPVKMLLLVYESKNALYASTVAKKTGFTYTHVNEVLASMEKEGLLDFERHGRLKILVLTEKGKKLAEELQRIASCNGYS